jgi:hypothetical protein
MNCYIVRIYREEQDNPRTLVGVVEEVGKKGKRAFVNLDELWEIMNPGNKSAATAAKADMKGGDREDKAQTETFY